ncbi:hypothetical protein D3C73_1013940 [compost metagenome]
MSEVTFSSIRDGVISALAERLPEVRVLGEGTTEPLTPPFCMVRLTVGAQQQELNRRHSCSCSFTIEYVPAQDNPGQLIYEYAGHLYDLFREVEIDGALYRGIEMKHEVKEGVLHFHFVFRFLIWLPEPDEPKMRMLKEEERLKNDV